MSLLQPWAGLSLCSHLSPAPGAILQAPSPVNRTSVTHIMNITFIHTIATDVGHMGEINMLAVVRSTLEHCCISHRGPYVLGCANKKRGVEAAVAVINTAVILLTVMY